MPYQRSRSRANQPLVREALRGFVGPVPGAVFESVLMLLQHQLTGGFRVRAVRRDDADDATWDGAAEICDGLDNDCDLALPADEIDDDGDGQLVCEGDCDDGDDLVGDGFDEICDDVDNDCDLLTDETCWVQMDVGDYNTCAVTELGEIHCWGCGGMANYGQCNSPTGCGYVQVDSYRDLSCALTSSGAIECWGCLVDYGQCSPPT